SCLGNPPDKPKVVRDDRFSFARPGNLEVQRLNFRIVRRNDTKMINANPANAATSFTCHHWEAGGALRDATAVVGRAGESADSTSVPSFSGVKAPFCGMVMPFETSAFLYNDGEGSPIQPVSSGFSSEMFRISNLYASDSLMILPSEFRI